MSVRQELQRCADLLKRAASAHGPPWKDIAEARALLARAQEKLAATDSKSVDEDSK